ncbi:hypothetical protein DFH27DRAFT_541792 [Peziza echinospora]|nr:hypothetical protein DFH27DRAFT_541792 [Peziza echinospora]
MREGESANAPTSASRSSPQEEKARFTAVNNPTTNGNGGTIVVGHHRPAAGTSPAITPSRAPASFEEWSEPTEHTSSYKRKRTPEPTTPLHQTTSYAQHHTQSNTTPHHTTVLSHPTHESGANIEEDMNVGHSTMDDTFSERGNGEEDSKLTDNHTSRIGEGSPQTPGQEGGEAKKRKRQFANRTKTGCITCRRRKKKCDEGKPECELTSAHTIISSFSHRTR